ncbi:ROK family protein [Rhodoferax sp.]|uniref:ROK family transcriptional regulator n=1 Tax=Rhodoferax sp. TaxID=50421 RepID=UPI0025DD929B|nr:ROK family protein [Rhodoferax sp.]
MQITHILDAEAATVAPAVTFKLGKLEVQSELAKLISVQPGIGRADIARLTGMARSTVSDHVQPLLDLGLFSELRARYAGRGRPSVGLTLNARAGIVLVADIGITHVRLVIADLTRNKLAEDAFTPDFKVAPEVLLDKVVSHFDTLMRENLLQSIRVRTLVVGVASPVDFENGVSVRPPIMPGWDGFPIAAWLRKKMGITVLVDNDVNLMALGEARSRLASASPLLFVKVASGIGCGIITKDGALHRGADGDAGDIGHIRAENGGNVTCACGNVGCIEAIASVPSIVGQIRQARGLEPSEEIELSALVAAGDTLAIRLVREAAAQIGEVVATLVNMFNPSCIVLGGKLAHMSDDLLSGVRAAVYRRAPPLATRRLTIENSRVGREAGVLGGIALGVDNVLSTQGLQKIQSRP